MHFRFERPAIFARSIMDAIGRRFEHQAPIATTLEDTMH